MVPRVPGYSANGKETDDSIEVKAAKLTMNTKKYTGYITHQQFCIGQRRSPTNSRTMCKVCNVYNRGQSLPIQGLPQSCLKCHNATPMWDVQ